MDYTLAQYKPETFESLAYYGTFEKLVRNLGYPKEGCPKSSRLRARSVLARKKLARYGLV
ncbi:putative HAD-superfamily hydrolase, subfamily IG, 5'-nucleotidase, HAD-like superfamily [Helianthus anomalus]